MEPMARNLRTYSELVKFETLKDRFNYLRLDATPFDRTFGGARCLNQRFYTSPEWARIRREVILRDSGCDLALDGYDIFGKVIVHHMNPLTIDDIVKMTDLVTSPEFLVCVSFDTHNAIHYGDENLLNRGFPTIRRPGDTKLW